MEGLEPKKNILKSDSFYIMQTDFFAFICKFDLIYKWRKL